MHPRLLHARPTGMLESDVSFDFEASVAYCFLTRFPLFDFFFKVSLLRGTSHADIGDMGNNVL